jgi:hypothetical protein
MFCVHYLFTERAGLHYFSEIMALAFSLLKKNDPIELKTSSVTIQAVGFHVALKSFHGF